MAISPAALRALVKEISVSARKDKPLVVGGARELAAVLRRELGQEARPGAVRAGEEPEGAAILVYVLGREPDAEDEAALKRVRRARVPIVAVAAGPLADDVSIPWVLATDVVRVPSGEGFPLDAIARMIAGRLGEDAAPLAARVPRLRGAVAEQLVGSFARRNGVLGAATFVPGTDLPVLALNQLRLVLRLEQAHGLEIEPRERAPEIAAVLGAAFALRAAARELLERAPVARWAVQGAVAYAGTRALGAAAIGRIEVVGTPGRH